MTGVSKNEKHWQMSINKVDSKRKAGKFMSSCRQKQLFAKRKHLSQPVALRKLLTLGGKAYLTKQSWRSTERLSRVFLSVTLSSHCSSKVVRFESYDTLLTKSSHLNRSGFRASTIWTTISLQNKREIFQSL